MSLSTPERISIAQLIVSVITLLAGVAFFLGSLHVFLPSPVTDGPAIVTEPAPAK